MKASQLEVFRMVMRCGTVTAAAEALNVSQPALSQILLHTEDSLGFKLFQRSRGRLYPTAEANELFPEADRIFNDLEALRKRAQEMRHGKAGAIRLAASAPPSLSFVPRAIEALRRAHPDIPVLSYVLPVESILSSLEHGRVGLGVALSDQPSGPIEVSVIGETQIVCVMPQTHPGAGEPVSLADLSGDTLITYRRGTQPRTLLADALDDEGMALRPDIEIDMSFSALAFVQQGLGVALVDGLVPWSTFAGLSAVPFLPRVRLPVSVLTNPRYPISVGHQTLRAHLIEAWQNTST
ncbi:MAG: LysR family transcriptional regulator [Pseudomonadota bacterium]